MPSDAGARYDREVALDAADIPPQVTWGTSPEQVQPITGTVPDPEAEQVGRNQELGIAVTDAVANGHRPENGDDHDHAEWGQ